MNKTLETQVWAMGAVAVVLAVVLPPLIEIGIAALQATGNAA